MGYYAIDLKFIYQVNQHVYLSTYGKGLVYFAVQTQKAELIEQRLMEIERVKARTKLQETEKHLSGILYSLPTISIKAKDFAAEMTNVNVQQKNLYGEGQIATEHVDNNKAVRKMMIDRGIVPENLPPAEDVKKVERRLASEEKKALGNKNNKGKTKKK
jgi:DNA-damage-inducible protein D